jgi:hypothetical protein
MLLLTEVPPDNRPLKNGEEEFWGGQMQNQCIFCFRRTRRLGNWTIAG